MFITYDRISRKLLYERNGGDSVKVQMLLYIILVCFLAISNRYRDKFLILGKCNLSPRIHEQERKDSHLVLESQ
jgi:hypothetical protein